MTTGQPYLYERTSLYRFGVAYTHKSSDFNSWKNTVLETHHHHPQAAVAAKIISTS
jgi:hypothetical protein